MLIYYKEHKKVFFIYLVLVFLFYGNSLKNKYALDDDYVTVTNLQEKGKDFFPNHKLVSKGFKGIPKIWKSRYAHDSEGSFEYRPFTTTTFAVEYSIFGQNSFVSHLINLLLYFCSIWLLFIVLLKLFENIENKFNLAFLCSLLFLIHPIHTEVVDNLKCRDELLAFFCSLNALWFSLDAYKKPNIKNICLIILFLTIGLLSKRTAILFFAVIPLCILFFRKINLKHAAYILIAFVIIYVSIPLIKSNIVSEKTVRVFYNFENPLYIQKVSFFHKIVIGIKTFGFYVKFLIFPFPFRNYYGGNMFDLSPSLNSYFFIASGFMTTCVYYIYKLKSKLLLFSFLLFCGCIVPFMNIGTPAPGILGERFAYFSSFGFCLTISIILLHFIKNLNFVYISNIFSKPTIYIVPVVIICMFYIWNRNNDWYNKITLFEADIKYQENSAKANSLIANEYFEMLQSPKKKYPTNVLIQKCITHYTQAIKNDSSIYSAYNNVGVVYYSHLNDIPNAKKYFALAINKRPKYSQAFENLGNCYKQEKNKKKSYECYTNAIKINPKQYTAYSAAIDLFFVQKDYDKTLNIIKITEQTFPNNYELIVQKANCYLMKKDTLQAIHNYEEAYAVYPNQNIAQFLSQKYKENGNLAKAEFYKNK